MPCLRMHTPCPCSPPPRQQRPTQPPPCSAAAAHFVRPLGPHPLPSAPLPHTAAAPTPLQRRDRVGIWAPNCAEFVVLQYAAARLGAVLVNINPAAKAAGAQGWEGGRRAATWAAACLAARAQGAAACAGGGIVLLGCPCFLSLSSTHSPPLPCTPHRAGICAEPGGRVGAGAGARAAGGVPCRLTRRHPVGEAVLCATLAGPLVLLQGEGASPVGGCAARARRDAQPAMPVCRHEVPTLRHEVVLGPDAPEGAAGRSGAPLSSAAQA